MLTQHEEQLILEQYQKQQRQKLERVKMENHQQKLQKEQRQELQKQKRQHHADFQQLQARHQLEIKPLVVDLLAAGAMAQSFEEQQIQEKMMNKMVMMEQEKMMNKMVMMEQELKQMQCRHGHELNEMLERHKNEDALPFGCHNVSY
jgi:hypothetical protein